MVFGDDFQCVVEFFLACHSGRKYDRNFCFGHSCQKRQIGQVARSYFQAVGNEQLKHRKTPFGTEGFDNFQPFRFGILVNFKMLLIVQFQKSAVFAVGFSEGVCIFVWPQHFGSRKLFIQITARHFHRVHWHQFLPEKMINDWFGNYVDQLFGNLNFAIVVLSDFANNIG